jgi:hypothetical protein
MVRLPDHLTIEAVRFHFLTLSNQQTARKSLTKEILGVISFILLNEIHFLVVFFFFFGLVTAASAAVGQVSISDWGYSEVRPFSTVDCSTFVKMPLNMLMTFLRFKPRTSRKSY